MEREVLITAGVVVLVVITIAFAFWIEVAPVPKGGLEIPEKKGEIIRGERAKSLTGMKLLEKGRK